MSATAIGFACFLSLLLGWTLGYSTGGDKHEKRVKKLLKMMHKRYCESSNVNHGMYGLGYRSALEDISNAIKYTWDSAE